MDKTKRKSLIISYLKGSINLQEFQRATNEDYFNLMLSPDQILQAIEADLRDKSDANSMKEEILYFDQHQEENLDSLGRNYIENKKRNLILQVGRYDSLLADSEIREIVEKWGTTDERKVFNKPVEEYKNTSFIHLLKHLESHPEYNSEIQEILVEIENENGLSMELQELSNTINDKVEYEKNQQNKREELDEFIEESLKAFGVFLELGCFDRDDFETIRELSMKSYEIYKKNYSQLTSELADDKTVFTSVINPLTLEVQKELTPDLQQKVEQINKMIEQLDERYGNFTQEIDSQEKIRPQEKSIRDEIGEEFKPKTQEEKKDEKQAQVMWMHRLQANDTEVAKMQNGAHKKQEVVQLIKDLDRDMQKNNQQEQTNSDNEQR